MGTKIEVCHYYLAHLSLTIPQIYLSETYSAEDCNVRIGLKTLTLFESVSFDMEQMIMSVVR